MDTNLPTDPSTGSPERCAQVIAKSPDFQPQEAVPRQLAEPSHETERSHDDADSERPLPPPIPRDEPTLSGWQQSIGPICGLLSAILYTASNIGLRQCVDVNPYVVSAVKATPNILLLTPWIMMHWVWQRQATRTGLVASNDTAAQQEESGQHATASKRQTRARLLDFTVAAIFAQFLGNVAFQKALELIGISTVVPITLGTIIVCGAILGVVILKESIGLRKLIAMMTLITAVVVLAIPSQDAMDSKSPAEAKRQRVAAQEGGVATSPNPNDVSDPTSAAESAAVDSTVSSNRAWQIILGSCWAILSGLTYAYFGVAMRRSLRAGIGSATLMIISGVVGVVLLWGYSIIQLGLIQISEIHVRSWLWMSFAGLCNFIAFITLTASLKRLPLVAVNLINASQVALAATAGVILFSEPITVTLVIGLVLTLTGLMILARRTRASIVVTD